MDEVNPADNTNNKKPLISFWANADWLNPKSIITLNPQAFDKISC